MMTNEVKITEAQKKVIRLLRNGEIITHNNKNFIVTEGKTYHVIRWDVWNKLTNINELIRQQSDYPFYYLLTEKGKTIKIDTK